MKVVESLMKEDWFTGDEGDENAERSGFRVLTFQPCGYFPV